MRPSAGYSLAELLMALSVASLVLVGTMMVTSSAIRFNITGNVRADLTGTAVFAADQLQKDIEAATFISLPTPGGGPVLSGCTNYSSKLPNSRYDTTASVTAFYYCVATPAGQVPSLLRYQTVTSGPFTCPMTVATCGTTAGYTVVAREFFHVNEPSTSPDYFILNVSSSSGVELHYVIGVASASYSGVPSGSGLNTPTPQYQMVNRLVRTNIPAQSADFQ